MSAIVSYQNTPFIDYTERKKHKINNKKERIDKANLGSVFKKMVKNITTLVNSFNKDEKKFKNISFTDKGKILKSGSDPQHKLKNTKCFVEYVESNVKHLNFSEPQLVQIKENAIALKKNFKKLKREKNNETKTEKINDIIENLNRVITRCEKKIEKKEKNENKEIIDQLGEDKKSWWEKSKPYFKPIGQAALGVGCVAAIVGLVVLGILMPALMPLSIGIGVAAGTAALGLFKSAVENFSDIYQNKSK